MASKTPSSPSANITEEYVSSSVDEAQNTAASGLRGDHNNRIDISSTEHSSSSSSSSSSSPQLSGGGGSLSPPSVPIHEAGLAADDLKLSYADLVFGPVIGAGAYGKVYRGTYKGMDVAIKEETIRHKDLAKYLASEISTLRIVSHPHLIKYFGACQNEKSVYIVTEFMNGGDLSAILSKSTVPIPWTLRVTIAKDAIAALAWLHNNDLIHRDIKTENILVDDSWRAVVADYGFARKFAAGSSKSLMTILGTDEFMAPEVIFGEEYDERADVFSFGVVLAEIITRRTPGKNGFLMRLPKKKFAIDVDELKEAAPADTPPSLLECAVQCLAYEAEFRSTSEQVLEWLTDLQKELEAADAEELKKKKKEKKEGGGDDDEGGEGESSMPTSPRPSAILGKTVAPVGVEKNEVSGAGGGV